MIFGIEPFGTTWVIIGIILGVIILFLLCIFYDEKIDGNGIIALKAFGAIFACIFWPFVILSAVCAGVVAFPIYLGKKIRDFMAQREEKKIEKENFFTIYKQLK